MNPIEIPFNHSYIRENGLWVCKISDIPLPHDFNVVEQSIVQFPPKSLGGNHSHPRKEAFVCVGGELELVWTNENGEVEKKKMASTDMLLLFILPPNLAHAVVNNSDTMTGVLYEFADSPQHDVTQINIVEPV